MSADDLDAGTVWRNDRGQFVEVLAATDVSVRYQWPSGRVGTLSRAGFLARFTRETTDQ